MRLESSSDFQQVIAKNTSVITSTPDCVYHYTTIDALLGIIENSELWLTDRKYMNDINDEKYIEGKVKKILNPSNSKYFPGSILDEDFVDCRPQYIFSTSCDYDAAHQWLNYGKESPVCIEFDRIALETFINSFTEVKRYEGNNIFEDGSFAFPVFYDETIVDSLAEYLTGKYKNIFLLNMPILPEKRTELATASADFHVLYCCTKQAGFYAEKEYRFVVLSSREPCFRSRGDTLTPYIKVKPEKQKLTIKSIIIGPKDKNTSTEITLRKLLDKFGYSNNVQIKRSKLSVR
jgi:hypothetical protein